MSFVHPTIGLLLLVAMPPLLIGVINKTKALFAGRVGPSLLQPYWDLLRLMRKGFVFSTTTTWVFRIGPIVTLVATVLAGLLVPFGAGGSPIAFAGDAILFAYLFALGRFFTASAALDTGSPFEGMGAAREVTWACLAEPAVFFALLCLARLSGSLSLSGMLPLPPISGAAAAPLVLVAAGLFVVLLVETCRVPFDDPNTHLELTMVHEVMVLDHSGPLFGAILYGASVKLFVLGAVLMRIVLPLGDSPWLDWAWLTLGMVALAILIGVVESIMGRLRLRNVPVLLIAACLLTGFGFLLLAVKAVA